MDPCLVSLVAADYHGYKLLKHDPTSSWATHPLILRMKCLKRATTNLNLHIQPDYPDVSESLGILDVPARVMGRAKGFVLALRGMNEEASRLRRDIGGLHRGLWGFDEIDEKSSI